MQKIRLPFKINQPVLALGPQAKNTVCFAQGNFAYISPLHQDLSNAQDFQNFEKSVKYFLKKRPKIIAYDLHSEYQSSKYIYQLSANRYTLSAIQHHHAHIASCMAENNLNNERVIGVAFDGTGLGNDNNLWGAEFLLCDYRDFTRAGHLKEIPLLGGERAVLEPARIAAFWLYLIYKDGFLNLGLVKNMNKKKWRVLKNMYASGFNSPLASSMGRLFDAVGSLVLGRGEVNFEADLAIRLEEEAARYTSHATCYAFKIIRNKERYIIDPIPIFKGIVKDLKAKEPEAKIAYQFHLTVAEMIRQMSLILGKASRINKVALSGGVFQNNLLLCLALDLLYKEGFQVFTHKILSCNDSGVSLGQAVIAGFGD